MDSSSLTVHNKPSAKGRLWSCETVQVTNTPSGSYASCQFGSCDQQLVSRDARNRHGFVTQLWGSWLSRSALRDTRHSGTAAFRSELVATNRRFLQKGLSFRPSVLPSFPTFTISLLLLANFCIVYFFLCFCPCFRSLCYLFKFSSCCLPSFNHLYFFLSVFVLISLLFFLRKLFFFRHSGTTRKKSSGTGTGSTQPREYNWGATW
jgi:hypothetical protein